MRARTVGKGGFRGNVLFFSNSSFEVNENTCFFPTGMGHVDHSERRKHPTNLLEESENVWTHRQASHWSGPSRPL